MIDGALISHGILWLIGAMSLCAVISSVGALCSMGRSGYRKD